MTTFPPLRCCQIAAVLLALLFPEIASAQSPANQANLNIGGRRIVFKNVVAVRAKSSGENRIIVLATGQPVSADVVKKVKAKDAEDNVEKFDTFIYTISDGEGNTDTATVTVNVSTPIWFISAGAAAGGWRISGSSGRARRRASRRSRASPCLRAASPCRPPAGRVRASAWRAARA